MKPRNFIKLQKEIRNELKEMQLAQNDIRALQRAGVADDVIKAVLVIYGFSGISPAQFIAARSPQELVELTKLN